jgi:hypothetical protein
MAGAAVMRASAYREVGGYEPRLFLGAEEWLMGMDLAVRGWRIVYVPDVVTHHHPSSSARDPTARRIAQARNRLWIAWMRLPLASAWQVTLREMRHAAGLGLLRPALRQALAGLGFQVDGQALNTAFRRFKEIADKKKQVTAMDLEALVTDELRDAVAGYTLEWFDVEASSRRPPHATVSVTLPDGTSAEGSFTGDGPVDAIFHAINTATGIDARLREFRVDAVTGGQDALGEVSVVLELEGRTASGQGVATDILQAAGVAYTRALTVVVHRRRVEAEPPLAPERVGSAP